ncbi:MAG: ankyrin repeat protein [Myxococcota bacterium]
MERTKAIESLEDAILAGDEAAVGAHLSAGVSADLKISKHGGLFVKTLLNQAVKAGQLSVVQRLLSAGADPNLWDQYHYYPLHNAVRAANASICRALLDAGADVNAHADVFRMEGGETPLHMCVSSPDLEVVQVLMDCGADPQRYSRSFPRCSPLHLMAVHCSPDFVYDVIDIMGNRTTHTKLQSMILAGDEDEVEQLLEAGVDPRSKTVQGRSHLSYAKGLYRSSPSVSLQQIIDLLK